MDVLLFQVKDSQPYLEIPLNVVATAGVSEQSPYVIPMNSNTTLGPGGYSTRVSIFLNFICRLRCKGAIMRVELIGA